VVVNADFAHAMKSLVPNELRRRWTDARIDAKHYSCSTFMLYLGLKGTLDLAHHTIFLSRDYERNIREIEEGKAPAEPSIYVQNASVTDSSLAPPGIRRSTCWCRWATSGLARTGGPSLRPTGSAVLDRLEGYGPRTSGPLIRHRTDGGAAQTGRLRASTRARPSNSPITWAKLLHLRPRNRLRTWTGLSHGAGPSGVAASPPIFERARMPPSF
jgi:phytoene desaturase